ncbi:MAG: bifunctional oligoribonuclease/PAP phosphatase NrnA [Candidatus Kerfeldbacteria bacterium]|nr:bifunctional oligoribonuclease/PAP phosphatase NrnA [Candidatus Kerfeldbacteria bacterium]
MIQPYHHHAQRFRQLVTPANRILLTITKEPDGDSLGSMVAMARALKHFGKQPFCYSPDAVPSMFSYLTAAHPIMRDLPDSIHDYHLIMIFDAGDLKRTPLVAEFIKRNPGRTKVLNIDHHPTVSEWQGRSAVDHHIIDTQAGSTTEMLWHLFDALAVPLDRYLATCLLTGILTDTGHFTNQGTSQHSLEVAAQLMAKGAQHRTITEATMKNKSLGTLKLWGRALSRLRLNPQTGLVSTVLTEQDFSELGLDDRAMTGIANFLNGLREGRLSLVLSERPGGIIKASLRTNDPNVNVTDMAAEFGGGGHPKAAGFQIRGQLVETKHGWRIIPAGTDR